VVFVRCDAGYTPAVQEATEATEPARAAEVTVTLTVDGSTRTATVDTRTSLLDALRDRLAVTSPKKGCDHGQCGACTVLVDGRRTLSCLALAVAQQGRDVVTASGLDDRGDLHPMQEAFIAHDALQCGYCTPGQICSAVGVLEEAAAGHPSLVTDPDAPTEGAVPLSDEEIRERMSGNLCRCGAYVDIVAAIRDVAAQRSQVTTR
jgi:xanthine dehydrogenase YagT iron-sulfur-binding subunit